MSIYGLRFIAIGALVLAPILTGCAKRPALLEAKAPAPVGAASPRAAEPPAPAPAVVAAAPAPAPAPPAPVVATPPPAPKEFEAVAELKDIHFDFDKYAIRPGDAKILDANAAWLRSKPDLLVLIEGHCDERGTNEYNLTLGERRARAAMSHLVAQGVQQTRITILSYGEERPLCTEHTERCWAQNR